MRSHDTAAQHDGALPGTTSHSAVAHQGGHGVRQDVQGLRGVAVLLVVLFHAGVPGIAGGFVGVDVFFVISGFLISRLLLADIERHGSIRFANFFARRAKRLLPAALVLLAIVAAVSLWLYPPSEQREWLSAARASALYVSNVWLAGRALDYFATETHDNALLHTWSLSVEEQFYIVWPLVLAVLARGLATAHAAARQRLLLGIAGIAAVSFLACVWLTGRAQPWAFFGMPLRAWEFALGALAALVYPTAIGARAAAVLATLGAACIAAAAVALREDSGFPGFGALLPAGGTALLLLGLRDHGHRLPLSRWLSCRPLSLLGDMSYSWYLWHWPALVWLAVLWPQPTAGQIALAVALSLAAAWASLHLVENPVRRARLTGWRDGQVIAAALVGSIAMAAAVTAAMSWQPRELPDALRRAELAVKDRPRLYELNCHQFFFDTQPKPCRFGPADATTTVVLFGDSHAAQWFPALESIAQRRGWQLITMTKAACPALDLQTVNPALKRNYDECDQWRLAAVAQIASIRPQLVVASSANYYQVTASQRADALGRTVGQLRLHALNVLVIRDTPRPGFVVPTCLARTAWRKAGDASPCTYARDSQAVWRDDLANAERAAVERITGGHYLDLSGALCVASPCPVTKDSVVMFADAHHLTATYAASLSHQLESAADSALAGGRLDRSNAAAVTTR